MRLDLGNPKTVKKLDSNIVLDAVRDDSPVDVCRNCYVLSGFGDDVEHPPYDDGNYKCAICGAVLDWDVD